MCTRKRDFFVGKLGIIEGCDQRYFRHMGCEINGDIKDRR